MSRLSPSVLSSYSLLHFFIGIEKKGKKKRARRAEDHVREITKEEVQPLKNESKLEDLSPPQSVKEEKRVEKPRAKRGEQCVIFYADLLPKLKCPHIDSGTILWAFLNFFLSLLASSSSSSPTLREIVFSRFFPV